MDHIHISITAKLECVTDFARQAAEELAISDKVGVDLPLETGRTIGILIADRARDLESEAEDKRREEERLQKGPGGINAN